MNPPEPTASRASIPGLQPDDAPVFAEPWQAEAFAMVVALHGRGLFSWSEWADALSAELKRPDAAIDGGDYFEHWVRALETILAAKGIAEVRETDRLTDAWQRAAHATPHGRPILLENDPLWRSGLSSN